MTSSLSCTNYLQRIVLADISRLRGYERLSERGIQEVTHSLTQSRILQHPVVCDFTHSLVIDGQHRIEALKRLGIKLVPVFKVDYLSDQVTIKSWLHRVFDAEPEVIKSAIHKTIGFAPASLRKATNWAVVLKSCRGSWFWEFEDSVTAAESLHWVLGSLSERGYSIQLIAAHEDSKPKEAQQLPCDLFISPVVGKREVLEVVNVGRKYPAQINRHLIHLRALKVNCPINILTLPVYQAASQFERHLLNCRSIHIGADNWIDGRRYEEDVVYLTP